MRWNPKEPVIFKLDDNDEQRLPQFYFYKPLETKGGSNVNAFSKSYVVLVHLRRVIQITLVFVISIIQNGTTLTVYLGTVLFN